MGREAAMPSDRKPSTEAAYRKRATQLVEEAKRKMERDRIPWGDFVRWLIDEKRAGLAPSSWRQYRSAVVWLLEQGDARSERSRPDLIGRINVLKATPPSAIQPEKQRTSAMKAKKLPPDDFNKIVRHATNSDARDADSLKNCLQSGLVTGLRPIEWARARLVENPKPGFAWALIAPCAKHDDDRSHSEWRTLYFQTLPPEIEQGLKRWLATVAEAEAGAGLEALLKSLSDLMRRITRAAFPRRKKFPTLYSTRHEAAARWKAAHIEIHSDPAAREEGAAIVAALLGHATDETATQHYARARSQSGATFPIPEPDPEEVARVRRKIAESRLKFNALQAKANSRKTGKAKQ